MDASLAPIRAPAPASIATLSSTLGTLYRVTLNAESIPHRRIFIGSFIAVDPQGNLVLDRTVEFEYQNGQDTTRAEAAPPVGRDVGMVLIPRKWWGTVEREVTLEEQMGDSLAGLQLSQRMLDAGQDREDSGCAQS